MMFHLFTSSLLLITLTAIIGSVDGACLPCQRRFNDAWYPELIRRVVYSPKITNPNSSTIWTVGSLVTVEWDCKNVPPHITNTKGKLVLGRYEEGSSNEHLDLEKPLADGFDIRQCKVTIKVPSVVPGDDYIVVLFGDSGNRSPAFRIKANHHAT